MRIAIHQPEYFPWLGFLDKARRVDTLVLLDDVQFDRSSLQHRARLLGPGGEVMITIPFVHAFPQRIDETRVADARWPAKHWKTLRACYGRAPGWRGAAARLEAFFAAPRERLVDATAASVTLLLEAFAVPTKIVRAGELDAGGGKGERVLRICRALGATRYLSGRTGAGYLDGAAFAAAGVALEVQQFTPPAYRSFPGGAEGVRGLSALDAWLHLGDDAPRLLEASP